MASYLDYVIPGAMSLYDMYQQRDAVGDATNQAVSGYTQAGNRLQEGANRSLDVLGSVYNQGRQTLRPYSQFGTKGLAGYNKLMRRPNSITSNPGYKFRFNQGQTALERSAAAKGMHLSGNTLQDLQEYGQGYAMDEYDRALAREAFRIQTGQGATNTLADLGQNYSRGVAGIYTGLAEGLGGLESDIGAARAGGTLGRAGATSGTLGDLMSLYQQFSGNGSGGVTGAATELANLATAGNGNPLAAIRASMPGSGNEWATAAGPRTTAKMPTGANTLATGYAGTVGTATALGTDVGTGMYMGADGLVTDLTGMAAGETGAAGATGPFGTGPLGIAAVPAVMWGGLEFLQNVKNFKGGSAEGAKIGKFTTQLQNDMRADPTGAKATQTMKSLINGGLWAGEGNQWVIGTLMKDGVLGFNSPLLYGQNSIADPFASKGSDSYLGKDVELQSYGIPEAQAKRYTDILTKQNASATESSRRTSGADSRLSAGRSAKATPQELEFMRQIEARMTPQAKLQTAIRTRQQILAANPRADITKLNQFIRSAS